MNGHVRYSATLSSSVSPIGPFCERATKPRFWSAIAIWANCVFINPHITAKLRPYLPLCSGEHPDRLCRPALVHSCRWKTPAFSTTLNYTGDFRPVSLIPVGRGRLFMGSRLCSRPNKHDLDFLDLAVFLLGYYRHQRSGYFWIRRGTRPRESVRALTARPRKLLFRFTGNASVRCCLSMAGIHPGPMHSPSLPFPPYDCPGGFISLDLAMV